MNERVQAVWDVNGSFQAIAFVVVDVEENERAKGSLLKKVASHQRYRFKNERDLQTLLSLGPGVVRVKRIKVALFVKRNKDDLRELKEYFSELEDLGLEEQMKRALKAHHRYSFYNYVFHSLYVFEGENVSRFPEFIALVMTDKVRNVLFVTDENLYYLYNSVLDKRVLESFLIVERTVCLQPYEYTEQIVKYVFIPVASSREGSIVFITFSSPLLKLNGFKARYRRIMERAKDSVAHDGHSNAKKPFVSFHDKAIDAILSTLGFNVISLPKEIEKIFKIVAIISHPKVFPMLASYVDYAGLYGASQLLRGYSKSGYTRLEDIESKVDLMLRGHLKYRHGLSSEETSKLINYYNYSGLLKKMFNFWRKLVAKFGGKYREVLSDPVVGGLLFALSLATNERRALTDVEDDPVVDTFFLNRR